MQAMSAAFSSLPAGLTYVASYPMLNLGDAGRIPVLLPGAGPDHTTQTRVPKLTGPLAGASYDLIAQARSSEANDVPGSLTWLRGIDVTKTVSVAAWMATPSVVAVAAGTYSFGAVSGATHPRRRHRVDRRRAALGRDDLRRLDVVHAADPDPGSDPGRPGPAARSPALKIPGVDLNNAVFDDLQDKITDLSTNAITFTH